MKQCVFTEIKTTPGGLTVKERCTRRGKVHSDVWKGMLCDRHADREKKGSGAPLGRAGLSTGARHALEQIDGALIRRGYLRDRVTNEKRIRYWNDVTGATIPTDVFNELLSKGWLEGLNDGLFGDAQTFQVRT